MDGMDDRNSNGEAGPVKKKRKSFNEKFLEDNSEYYGFQVLPSKLRSSEAEPSSTTTPIFQNWDFLHTGKVARARARQIKTFAPSLPLNSYMP